MNRDACPRLLSLAVHEFRTPVTVVAGYIRMLLKMHGTSLNDQQRRLLEEAEKSCGRLSGLIAELSDLANLDSGQRRLEQREIDLFPLVAEVAATVHEGADREVRLQVAPDDSRAVVVGDRERLGQAIATLMTATLRERADPGLMRARCGVGRNGRDPFAWVTIAPDGTPADSSGFRQSDWTTFEPWRGGLGFRVVIAHEVIGQHGGALYSAGGAFPRAACAITLPVKE